MDAHREIFFEIPYAWIIYILAAISITALAYAFYRRLKLWRAGTRDDSFSNIGLKTKAFIRTGIVDGLLHRKILRDRYSGIFHILIMWGALLLLFGTALDVISHYIVDFLHGNTYLAISFLADLGGVMIILGVIALAARRYIQKPDRLDNRFDDWAVLYLIFVIVISGFIVEGLRMVVTDATFTEQPIMSEWAPWSFFGFAFAKAFEGGGRDLLFTYQVLWWFHSILVIGAIFYIALRLSKLTHIVVSPINVLFRSSRPKGALRPLDLSVNPDQVPSYGASEIYHFTFKDLLDLDACTRCGRCQELCPAYLSGKPLSPKNLIQNLKASLTEQGPIILKSDRCVNDPFDGCRLMMSDVVTEDEIWSCTTCRFCQEQCPVYIEPINKIIEMRRNLVLEQTKFPETAMSALRSMEQRGHPWQGIVATKEDWAEGQNVKLIGENGQIDILYWVGCTAALEERNIKIAKAVVTLLRAADVNFAILGNKESCCGEPARRIGNEYLFQTLAKKNIDVMKKYEIKKIVTSCPHCFNTIKNEYPQFGGDFEVVHHTEFLADLIKQGKLKVSQNFTKNTTYHDSCYLGRYNDIYAAPRLILQNVMDNGNGPLEMEHTMNKAFCCGAGGGRMWMEEQIGRRINQMRTEEAIDVKAEVIASACPFCLQMFEDAIKSLEQEGSMKAMDISEILLSNLKEQ